MKGTWFDIAASLLSIGAGLYLLTQNSVGGQSTWLDALGHGIGAYFIAKGWFMARSLHFAEQQMLYLAALVDQDALDDEDA